MVTAVDITLNVYIDWDADGSFATSGDDISAYYKRLEIRRGFTNPLDVREHVAAAGYCDLVLNNADKRFSPGYSSSPVYGKLLPGLPVKIEATDGVTTWPVWTGWTADIQPQAGVNGDQECTIHCVDTLTRLQAFMFSLPLFQHERASGVVNMIAASALDGAGRVVTLSIGSNPSNGEYFQFIYTNQYNEQTTRQYVFRTAISVSGDVLIGTSKEDSADNLIAAINSDTGAGTLYHSDTPRGQWLTAGDRDSTSCPGGTATYSGSGDSQQIGENGTDSNVFLMTDKTGVLSQLKVTLDTNVGSPSGDITWTVTPVTETLPGIYTPDSDTANQSTGTFTPTPSAENTINISGGIFMKEGQYYQVILADPGADVSNHYQWVAQTDPTTVYSFKVITSAVTSADVVLTASAKGDWANENDSGTLTWQDKINVTKSGAYGDWVDTTAGANATITADIDEGINVFSYVGDRWRGDVDALTALNDLAICEWGYLWIDNEGGLVFHNKAWFFQLYAATAALTLDNEQFDLLSGVMFSDILNDITVTYTPPGVTTNGTIIQARSPIQVPGQWGTSRWTGVELPIIDPAGGSTIVKFPAQDSSGNYLGIQTLDPLVEGTNYTVNENADSSGFDYTGHGHIGTSEVINGGNVELSLTNDALGPLYVINFYQTGTGLIMYDPQQAFYADQDSVDTYGRRSLAIYLPIPLEHRFIDDLAAYLLLERKDPVNRVRRVSLSANRQYGGTNPHVVDLGDTILITEDQTSISSDRHVVMGIEARYTKGAGGVILLDVLRVPDSVYGIYGTSTYGNCVYAL